MNGYSHRSSLMVAYPLYSSAYQRGTRFLAVYLSKVALFSLKRVACFLFISGYATGPPSVTDVGVLGDACGVRKELIKMTSVGVREFLHVAWLRVVLSGGHCDHWCALRACVLVLMCVANWWFSTQVLQGVQMYGVVPSLYVKATFLAILSPVFFRAAEVVVLYWNALKSVCLISDWYDMRDGVV